MDFPLDFKVCFQPTSFNETVLKSYGYGDSYLYANGMIHGNSSHALVGWGGNQSISVKNASEILHAAKYDWTMSQVLKNLQISTGPNFRNLSFTLQRLNWFDSCYLLNTTVVEKNNLSNMSALFMLLDEILLRKHNVTVELKLQGQNLAAHRESQAHSFYHSGDALKLEKNINIHSEDQKEGVH